ncbi:MAG: alpha-galactosidase [Chloroflexia bacterium]|nr:alpha-galactosidase [Chloroflexia bacterium]
MQERSLSPDWQQDHRGVTLSNAHWRLRYDMLLGLFDLSSPAYPNFYVRWARACAHYRQGKRRLTVGTDDGRAPKWEVQTIEDERGAGLRLTVQNESGRQPTLTFRATLYERSPALLLEITLHNVLSAPIEVDRLVPLEIDPQWGGRMSLGRPINGIYSTGWQSWSPAGWKPANAFDLRTHYAPLSGPVLNAPAIPPLRSGQFWADMVGLLTADKPAPNLLVGLLSTADQFGALQADLRHDKNEIRFICDTNGLALARQERISSERVVLLLPPPDNEVLSTYGDLLGQEMGSCIPQRAPRGWCSWTAFYLELSEQDILRQLQWLAQQGQKLPLDVVQIDDGWEQRVGDWQANERFAHGMGWLAAQIRQAGFRPGLWLAPFIVHPQSQLAASHPEWLVQNERGRPASAGLGWGTICHALDLTQTEVQTWVRRLIHTVCQNWGYSYLKLDFLYAAAIAGQRQRSDLTRAQILRRGLDLLRQAAGPDVFILGCGCPLGPAIGLVDGMRISADIAPHWQPRWGLLSPLVRGERAMPAMVNAVQNDLAQAWMHRRLWLNDPDALILRQADSELSAAEVRSLATVIGLSGGLWMLGDDLETLEEEGRAIARAGLPLHPGQPRVLDLLREELPSQVLLEHHGPGGKAWIVALFNWQDQSADLALDLNRLRLEQETRLHLHEFWSEHYRQVQGRVHFAGVPAHDCRLFLLRPIQKSPQWVGGNLHMLQGQTIQSWRTTPEEIELTLSAERSLQGYLLLWLPNLAPRDLQAPGLNAHIETVQGELWRLFLRTEQAGRHTVRLGLERKGG